MYRLFLVIFVWLTNGDDLSDKFCCSHSNPSNSFSDSSSHRSRGDYASDSSSKSSSRKSSKKTGKLNWRFPCAIFSNNMDKCMQYGYRGCQWNCNPTQQPTGDPTVEPTKYPTYSPSAGPTKSPTVSPVQAPSVSPTLPPTNAPTDYPTIPPTTYICSEIESCGQCAIITDCVWCNNTCQYYKETCPDKDLLIDEEYGCDDYNPVGNCGMDKNEVLTYQIRMESCAIIESNTTIEVDGNDRVNTSKCDEHFITTKLWVKTANVHRGSYQVLGRLEKVTVNNQDILLGANESIKVPPCEAFIKFGRVRNITCPKDLIEYYTDEDFDGSIFESNDTNGSRPADLSGGIFTKQRHWILNTLRYILPRLDSQLFIDNESEFDPNASITEYAPNGVIAACRIHTHDNNSNMSHIHLNYGITEFLSTDELPMPQGLVVNSQFNINESSGHVNSVIFSEIIQYRVSNDTVYEFIDQDFMLIDEQTLPNDTDILDKLTMDLYNYSLGYITYKYTAKQWKQYDDSDNALPNNNRRRMGADFDFDFNFDGDMNNNDNKDRRRMGDGFNFDYDLGRFPDDAFVMTEYGPKHLVDTCIDVGFTCIKIDVIVHFQAFWHCRWVQPADVLSFDGGLYMAPVHKKDDIKTNGCYGFADQFAALSLLYKDEIEDCCEQHALKYATCGYKKDKADKELDICVNPYDLSNSWNSFNQRFPSIIKDLWYIRNKLDYCDLKCGDENYGIIYDLEFKIWGQPWWRSGGATNAILNEVVIPIINFGFDLLNTILRVFCFPVGWGQGLCLQLDPTIHANVATKQILEDQQLHIIITTDIFVALQFRISLDFIIGELGVYVDGTIIDASAQYKLSFLGLAVYLGQRDGRYLVWDELNIKEDLTISGYHLKLDWGFFVRFRILWFKCWKIGSGWFSFTICIPWIVWTPTIYITRWSYQDGIPIDSILPPEIKEFQLYPFKGQHIFEVDLTFLVESYLDIFQDALAHNFGPALLNKQNMIDDVLKLPPGSWDYAEMIMSDNNNNGLPRRRLQTLSITNSSTTLPTLSPTKPTPNPTLNPTLEPTKPKPSFMYHLIVQVFEVETADFIVNHLNPSLFASRIAHIVGGDITNIDVFIVNLFSQTVIFTNPTEQPTPSPSAAPTLAPTYSPTAAPTLAPTFCDQYIRIWEASLSDSKSSSKSSSDEKPKSKASKGSKGSKGSKSSEIKRDKYSLDFNSPCDAFNNTNNTSSDNNTIFISNYEIEFDFLSFVEYPLYSSNHAANKDNILLIEPKDMIWNDSFKFLNNYIYSRTITGYQNDAKFRYGPNRADFSISIHLFYQKYLSIFENGISISFTLDKWPFKNRENSYIIFKMKLYLEGLSIGEYNVGLTDQQQLVDLIHATHDLEDNAIFIANALFYVVLHASDVSVTFDYSFNNTVETIRNDDYVEILFQIPYFQDKFEYNGIKSLYKLNESYWTT